MVRIFIVVLGIGCLVLMLATIAKADPAVTTDDLVKSGSTQTVSNIDKPVVSADSDRQDELYWWQKRLDKQGPNAASVLFFGPTGLDSLEGIKARVAVTQSFGNR